jgi:hypothetical protein
VNRSRRLKYTITTGALATLVATMLTATAAQAATVYTGDSIQENGSSASSTWTISSRARSTADDPA